MDTSKQDIRDHKMAQGNAKIEGQLQDIAPSEIDSGDMKIAKKKSKKNGTETDEEIHARFVAKNEPQASALWAEFGKKLTALGYSLQPVLAVGKTGIRPDFEFIKLPLAHMKAMQEKMEQQEIEDAKVQEATS